MTAHEFVHKITPLWRALIDIENLASDIHRSGNYNLALTIVQIARDTRYHFSVEEDKIVRKLLEEK